MRRLLAVVLLACLCQGCFVFDEINEGQKYLDEHGGHKGDKPKPTAQGSPAPAPEDEPGPVTALIARAQTWWEHRNEEKEPERPADDVIVRCEQGGSIHFTHKSECLVRGGKVL